MPKSQFSVVVAALVLPLSAVLANPAAAQGVVQALPDPAEAELAQALARLEGNPRNISALLAAGNASLQLGDSSAALSFFNRAQEERPDDPRVLTGLAQIAVQRGEAVTAIRLFDNADAQGGRTAPYAAERGLAYDLVGNNARAQRFYRQALSREESDEVVRRLALSYAISGDGAAAEATLLPLLQRQDRAAFRTRAFILAILGQDTEAITIAETMLPARLSQRLTPYLQYMPRLTPAQQAAAANLGRFPSVADIGRDSEAIAALAQGVEPAPPPAAALAANDRLTPAGTPLGSQATEQLPVVQTVEREASGELPALASSGASAGELPPVQQPDVSPAAAATLAVEARADAAAGAPVVTAPVPDAAAARPSFSISPGVTFAERQEQTGEQLELAEAFADFRLPPGGIAVQPSAGAVDITAITPARPAPPPARTLEPEPEPEPAPPAHPSRHWVQVATGQDIAAFRFDWRRIVRNADGLLDGRDAYTAPWGQANRLVTGPFDSRQAANAFVTQLAEAGVEAFRFTSAEGEEVSPIN